MKREDVMEEKKNLPKPPQNLNAERPLPPRPPVINNGVASNAENKEISQKEEIENKQNTEIKTDIKTEKQPETAETTEKVKKEKIWNRKPLLWSGILLAVAVVAILVFCLVAL